MSKDQKIIDSNLEKDYEYGFVTDIESDTIPPGLDENVIKTISRKKNEPKFEWGKFHTHPETKSVLAIKKPQGMILPSLSLSCTRNN